MKKLKLQKEQEWLRFDEESMELSLVSPVPEDGFEKVYLEFELKEEVLGFASLIELPITVYEAYDYEYIEIEVKKVQPLDY